MDGEIQTPWHSLGTDQVLAQLDTSRQGLSSDEARRRLARVGANELTVDERPRPLDLLLDQVRNPIIYILLAAAVVSALLGQIIATLFIVTVEAINVTLGFFQEYKAEQTLHALASMTAPRARVVRDGEEREIDARQVVPGDVVILRAGAKIPADLRLLRTTELQLDESILTGEALPAAKGTAPIADPSAPPGDQANMAFMGTTVARGRAAGVVVRTGLHTLFGQISAEVRRVGEVRSPLERRLDAFAQTIALLVLAATVLIVVIGVVTGRDLVEVLLIAVSTAVATVPEGLPVTVTVALAVGVYRMAQRKAIIRKLPVVEALGSCTLIGSDKTGTLTKNEMTVTRIYAAGKVFDVSGTGYAPLGGILRQGRPVDLEAHPALAMALRIGLLSNDSEVYQEKGHYHVDGDPTEGALIVAAIKGGLRQEPEQAAYPLLDEIPFESARQYMATLHEHGGRRLIFVKGAPERVLAMAELSLAAEPVGVPEMSLAAAPEGGPAGPPLPLGALGVASLDRRAVRDEAHQLASQGLRVLAMAYKEAPLGAASLERQDVESELIFVGLQAMIDPPRPEAITAIANAKRAGIDGVMITGDHRVTAEAIARRMGIGRDSTIEVIDGRELEAMSDAELYARVPRASVFSRASPQQKLRVVRQMRERGEVVAMTGDGVNDAPALKQADIGVAMGIAGTDVAKEAADMVVTDDNFATIYAAIEEGRVVFDNIRKVIVFLIPTGLGLVLTVAAAVALGLPLPFLPQQAIWINLVTNGLQDVAMAFEPPAPNVGRRPPRNPKAGLLTPLMVQRTVLVGIVLLVGTIALYSAQLAAGASLDAARTVAMTTMVLFQNFHIFNSRAFYRSAFTLSPFSNPFLLTVVVVALGLHLLAVYWPPLQFLLRTAPLSLGTWAVMVAVASSVLWVVEIDKAIRRLRRR